MKLLKKIFITIALMGMAIHSQADEGMWPPIMMSGKQYKDMAMRGFRLSPEDLYSINQASLKDAIVLFGSGCTGEIVSEEGLLFTNHHCGYSRIQQHSSVTNDYLTNGFWAMSKEEELANPGLTVTILVRMEDVTTTIISRLNSTMTEKERKKAIKHLSDSIAKQSTKDTHYEAEVVPFYYGNQFVLMVTEVFKDVRLVGAPPSSIGKFGGDTDNWVWPRHTGDFAIFRIYADNNNKPAEYSKANKPYKPRKFFEISLEGVKEGDFTMVYGFPAKTEQYLPSMAIKHLHNDIYPITVGVRDKELEIMNQAMSSSQKLHIMYAARQASVANAWKKLKGVILGLENYRVVGSKGEKEQELVKLFAEDGIYGEYKEILQKYDQTYKNMYKAAVWNTTFNECFFKQPLFRFAFKGYWLPELNAKAEVDKSNIDKTIADIAQSVNSTYRGFEMQVEKKIFAAMISEFISRNSLTDLPPMLQLALKKHSNNIENFSEKLISSSIFRDSTTAYAFFSNWKPSSIKKLKKDPLFKLMSEVVDYYRSMILPDLQHSNATLDSLHRVHMAVLIDLAEPGSLYPDANFTLRITYGAVMGSKPRDGVEYLYQTTLSGVIEKGETGIDDYYVMPKLKTLASEDIYGEYGHKGSMPVAFIATNHTTGGNSGSPVLDGNGRLIGINFDRAWEGTMSDLNYAPEICRNISIDIRYLLFIVDKYAGATHLLDEMVIHRR